MEKARRPYFIVVWGATGFTGTLVCEYLAVNIPDNLKLAIAGRNRKRLEEIKSDLIKLSPKAKDIGILVGELSDQESIDAITKQTRVVLSTAGPFIKFGTPIVASCVRHGTDYCDITGETQWVKKVRLNYSEEARNSGAIIVNCCGWDCVPNDLGSYVVVDYVKKNYNVNIQTLHCLVTYLKGGISGGTLASINEIMNSGELQTMKNPYYLINEDERPKVRQPQDILKPVYDKDVKMWKFPYLFGPPDSKFIRLSQHLLGYPCGQFGVSVAQGTKSFLRALIGTFMLAMAFIVISTKLGRWVLGKAMPPGAGPKRSSFNKGGAKIAVVAKLEQGKQGVPKFVKGKVQISGDPGYYVTSKMVSECALCLATQRDSIPAKQGGFYTPSSSMGLVVVERLNKIGVTIEAEGPYNP